LKIAPENIVKSLEISSSQSSPATALQRRRRSGSSIIEMVLAIWVLLFMAFGMVEFGQFIFIRHAFVSAARDGARTAALPTTTTQAVIDAAITKTLAAAGVANYTTSWCTVQQSSDGTNYFNSTFPLSSSNISHGDAISITLLTNYSQLPAAIRPLSGITANKWGISTNKNINVTSTAIRE
jgi:Flp pilus assembly protein TadG